MTNAAEWSGPVGGAWAKEWQRTDRMLSGLAPHLDSAILAAAPPTGGKALDIGCGAGSTSLALATARADLAVTGLDVSAELVAVAQTRVQSVPNCTFLIADLDQDLAIADPMSVDLVISRHGVMFFADPAATFARLRTTARPGASLVFSCFRAGSLNPWASTLIAEVTGTLPGDGIGYAPGPFGFADPAVPIAFLRTAGWHTEPPLATDFTYVAGHGADPLAEAVALLRRIGPVASAIRTAADPHAMVDRLATVLERYRTGDLIAFPAAAWLWRATG